MALTEQQKKFCDNFIKSGNATQSYMDAGYKAKGEVARANASRLLTKANVKEYIKGKSAAIEAATIADMKEIKEFWTTTLRNQGAEVRDRMKASELMAKTYGAFLDRVEHGGGLSITIIPPERVEDDAD
jgi:phage terminase small subunit